MSLTTRVQGSETPELTDLILAAIRANQLELNTAMPGTIVSYDSATQTATVQPSFKRTRIDPIEVISRPQIEDVRVVFPQTNGRGIIFPVEQGDSVLLIFSQRSLDNWIDEGGEVQLTDSRLHNVNDCIAIPGLAPVSEALDPSPASDATEVRGDKILIGNTGSSDEPMVLGNVLQTNLENLISAIKDLTALLAAPTPIGTVTVAALGTPTPVLSTIVTAPVDAALTAVESALPDENSDFIFGEKSP